MGLNLPGLNIFAGQKLFKNSPEDTQVLESQGSRRIPVNVEITTNIQDGPNDGHTAVDDATIGTVAWTNPTFVINPGSQAQVQVNTNIDTRNIKLVKAGSVVGDGETYTLTGAPSQLVFEGGSTSLWGTTWTPAQINATTFGCVVWMVGDDPQTTHYLKITNFGFAIPTGATILGIEAFIFGQAAGVSPNTTFIDNVSLKIYYSIIQ